MAVVTIQLGSGYVEDLAKRMKKHKISQAALARELGLGPSQVTRWFTKNPARKVTPQLSTAERIEEAMLRLQRRRA
jgi:transcriptional regulator with XRE-family HTH domain